MANDLQIQKLLTDIGEKLTALDNREWPVSTITVRVQRTPTATLRKSRLAMCGPPLGFAALTPTYSFCLCLTERH